MSAHDDYHSRRREAARVGMAKLRQRKGAVARRSLPDKPWIAEGVSRRTWFRRQAQAPAIKRIRPVYFNDGDAMAAHVLRELIAAGVIPPGDVDSRSIEEIQADDIRGYRQVHLFAGGGGWALAAQAAGWPEEKPLFTGSPPCQSFSTAGQRRGYDDPRDLWPHYVRLIRAIRPLVAVGEQVASKAGLDWFDRSAHDLRSSGYTVRGIDLAAAAVNAPHIRQRLYFVATANILENAESVVRRSSSIRNVAIGNKSADRSEQESSDGEPLIRGAALPERYWRDSELRESRSGERRRFKPGIRLLAHGLPGRVDANRIIGNAVCVPLAAQVLGAVLDVL